MRLVESLETEEEELARFHKKADAGDPSAMSLLVEHYFYKSNTLTSVTESALALAQFMSWRLKLANHDFVFGMLGFAYAYLDEKADENGEINPDIMAASFHWFQKAADLGSVEAMMKLAKWSMDGTGTEKNEKNGFSWYQKAAAYREYHDYSHVLLKLSSCYFRGIGTEKDEKEATVWERRLYNQSCKGSLALFRVCETVQKYEPGTKEAIVFGSQARNDSHPRNPSGKKIPRLRKSSAKTDETETEERTRLGCS